MVAAVMRVWYLLIIANNALEYLCVEWLVVTNDDGVS